MRRMENIRQPVWVSLDAPRIKTKVTDFRGETEKYSLVVSDKYLEYFFFQRKSYCEFWIEMFTSLIMLQSYDSCLFEEMK